MSKASNHTFRCGKGTSHTKAYFLLQLGLFSGSSALYQLDLDTVADELARVTWTAWRLPISRLYRANEVGPYGTSCRQRAHRGVQRWSFAASFVRLLDLSDRPFLRRRRSQVVGSDITGTF